MKQIYIHGLGQTSASWERTLSCLTDGEERVCPDLAELIQGREVNYQNLYLAFSDFCNEIDGVIDLCGLSLGGILALNYAVDYPERVHSLTLIAAQYKMPKKLLRFQNLLFRFLPEGMFQQMGFGKSQFIQLCKTMAELDFSSRLSEISCPVLVICGEKDRANKKASMELADTIEKAEFRMIRGGGHEVNMDAWEELAKVLGEFYG